MLSAEGSTDSLHLTEAGYVVWLADLRPVLIDILEHPATLPIKAQPA
ncbi:hypothetical protein [Cryobacterium sp. PAMC25264]|nr:hypothetical protein [Cryobacterium sp. PAMC25264]QYF74227.1 hypothetical protein KY500_03080 [Cryobacterium sp. PAMC25264]